jgi:hypothetical protein
MQLCNQSDAFVRRVFGVVMRQAQFAKLLSFAKNNLTSLLKHLQFADLICGTEAKMAIVGYARVSTRDQI